MNRVSDNKTMSTSVAAAVASKTVRNVVTGETVELKKLYEETDAAIFFFRRWGCMFCRLWAKELSEITPILRENKIRVVGVGVEEVGSKDFLDGKFFDGELYYVEDPDTYSVLGFKKFSTLGILASLFWKDSRAAFSKGTQMKVGGDLRGDWGQVGGALLVRKGGTLLKHFIQKGPGEHLSNEDILKLYNLDSEYQPKLKTGPSESAPECEDKP